MKTLAALLLIVTLSSCATTSDAQPAAPRTDSAEFQIQTTVLAVYNVVSGPAGRRDWDRFAELFAPEARLIIASQDGTSAPQVMTTKEYVDRFKPKYNETGFFQRPASTRVLQYGNIAHVWSTYEKRDTASQEQAGARGVDSFELVRIGNAWKVQSWISQPDDAAHPIPTTR
jgi:hypothetical protein